MKKFKAKFVKSTMNKFRALVIAILVICLAAAVTDSLILAEAAGFVNATPAVTVISLCACVVFALLTISVLANFKYVFAAEHLRLCIGPVTFKYAYKVITEVKENSSTGERFILFCLKNTAATGVPGLQMLLISDEDYPEFLKLLKEKNPGIIHTVFNPDDKPE